MFSYISTLILGFILFTNVYAQRNPLWATPVDAKHAYNLYLVDKGVYRSAQPDAKAFSELEQMGIKEVLNLRNYHNDENHASHTKLILRRVKMRASDCDWDEVIRALTIIKDRSGPIVIHCKHGADRTGLVLAMYRIVFQGWDKESAIDEMINGNYNFHTIYGNIPSFIRASDTEKLKKIVLGTII